MGRQPAWLCCDNWCSTHQHFRAGSRIHVYKFKQAGGRLDLESDTFNQLKPGLSSYADDPDAAARSLQPLLDVALQTVPDNLQVGDLHASGVGPVTEFVTRLALQAYGVSLARDRYCSYFETGQIAKSSPASAEAPMLLEL